MCNFYFSKKVPIVSGIFTGGGAEVDYEGCFQVQYNLALW
jgi:hypothetical protein